MDEKSIQTPRGIFPLAAVLLRRHHRHAGEEVAWDATHRATRVVERRDKQHPLSDDHFVAQLAAAGITVARRTVTKYRKAMGILNSTSAGSGAGRSKMSPSLRERVKKLGIFRPE